MCWEHLFHLSVLLVCDYALSPIGLGHEQSLAERNQFCHLGFFPSAVNWPHFVDFVPVGEVAAVRVRPRREPRPGGDLTAEIWVAPTLQNLPVRILIRQDAQTFVDLLLERLPQQAVR